MKTMNDDTWTDIFIMELRVRRVPGPAIGDAVASVRELIADSGQSAEEAFGTPRHYADSLALPAAGNLREQALRTVAIPVLGLFAFLVFTLAASAWLKDEPILLSAPQLVLMAVPVVLTLLFTWPFYARSVIRQGWLPVVLVLVAGACGALSGFVAPASATDAWLVVPALPVIIAAACVMLALSGRVQGARTPAGPHPEIRPAAVLRPCGCMGLAGLRGPIPAATGNLGRKQKARRVPGDSSELSAVLRNFGGGFSPSRSRRRRPPRLRPRPRRGSHPRRACARWHPPPRR